MDLDGVCPRKMVAFLIIALLYIEAVDSSVVLDCLQPKMNEKNIEIKETDPVGTEVILVENTSPQLYWTVSYNGSENRYLTAFFELGQGRNQTQILRLKKIIDLELLQVEHPPSIQLPDFSVENLTLQIEIMCRLNNGVKEETSFDVNVISVNEFSPYFLGAPFSVTLPEDSALGTEIYDLGSTAVDLDAGKSQLTFGVAPYIITEFDGRRWVRMDSNKNGRILLSQPLDFESLRVRENAYFFLNVTVTDEGGYMTSTSIQVGVQDANDQSIEFVYPNCSRPCIDVNYTVLTNESYTGILDVVPVEIACRDLDTLNSTIVYLLLSDNGAFFSLDGATGQLAKTAALVNDSFGYNISLLVEAREVENPDHSVQAEVTVFVEERKPRGSSTVVPAAERSDIECADNSIDVFIPEVLLPHVNGRNVTWRENSCVIEFNGTHYVGSLPLSLCGTTVTIDEDNVTFSNDIFVHKADNAVRNVVAEKDVTFGEDYETVIPVECIYPRENLVSSSYVPVKQHIRFFEKRYGDLELEIQQYESEHYSKPVSLSPDGQRQVPLDSDVYIRIAFKFDTQDLRLVPKKCIATSTPFPADPKWHSLIKDGCPAEGVRLMSGNDSHDVRFAFKAFDFRFESTGLVYVYCGVSVCLSNDNGCVTGCQSRNKRSAIYGTSKGSHLVSMGPFVVHHTEDSSVASTPPFTTLFAVTCLVVAMVAVVFAVIGWTRGTKEKPGFLNNSI